MTNFREAVEEIVRNRVCSVCSARHGCSTYVMNANSVCCAAFRDAEKDILTAHNAELDRIAEGCNKFKEKNANNVPYIKHDANRRIDKCQAYIQAQKEGM